MSDINTLIMPLGGNGFETFLGGLIVETDSEDEYAEDEHTTDSNPETEEKKADGFYINPNIVEQDPDDIVYNDTSSSDTEEEKKDKSDSDDDGSSSSSSDDEDNIIDYAEDLDAKMNEETVKDLDAKMNEETVKDLDAKMNEETTGGCGGCSTGCGDHRDVNIEPEEGIEANISQLEAIDNIDTASVSSNDYENVQFESDFLNNDGHSTGGEEEFESEFLDDPTCDDNECLDPVDPLEIPPDEKEEQNTSTKKRKNKVKSNETQVESNEDQIKGHEDQMESNEDQIKANETQVESNEDQIKANETQVESNEDQIKGHEDQMESNETQVESDEYSGGADFGGSLEAYLSGIP